MGNKKLLSCILSAAMVLTMVGCGSAVTETASSEAASAAESTETASASETAAETSASAGTVSQASEDEPITCSLLIWSPSEDQDPQYGSWLTTMCDSFAALHPNWTITFNYGVCTESDVKKTLPQDVNAGADVFIYGTGGIENLCQANALSEIGGDNADFIKKNYSDRTVQSVTYDGGIYGVPITSDTWYMFYDKSVFSEDDVKSLDTMLTKGKVAFPLANGFYNEAFFTANGCTFFGENGDDRDAGIDVGGEKGKQVTDYLVDLAANPNLVIAEPADAISMMREGKVNAYMCGSWQAAQTQELLGDNFGAATLPTAKINGKDEQMKALCSAKAVGVNATSENQEVAIALAMYLGGEDAQMSHFKLRGYVPCLNDLMTNTEVLNNPVVKAEIDTVNMASITRAPFTEMSYWWTPAQSYGEELRDGKITHDNAEEKTEELNTSANTSGVN